MFYTFNNVERRTCSSTSLFYCKMIGARPCSVHQNLQKKISPNELNKRSSSFIASYAVPCHYPCTCLFVFGLDSHCLSAPRERDLMRMMCYSQWVTQAYSEKETRALLRPPITACTIVRMLHDSRGNTAWELRPFHVVRSCDKQDLHVNVWHVHMH